MGSRSPLIVPHNLVDPVKVFADFCIDTRLSGDGTWVLTPGDDALKRSVTDQGASRVTLTGVLALFPNTGAQHGVCDVARVGLLTLLVFDDGDIGTSQGMRQAQLGAGRGAPSRNEAAGACSDTVWGQGEWLHSSGKEDGRRHLHKHYVIPVVFVGEAVVEVGVGEGLSGHPPLLTAVCLL